jgi:alkylated DNA repair protein alkB homolog 1
MYDDPDPTAAERTAFRKAEKQYKLYKAPNAKGRARTRSGYAPLSPSAAAAFISSLKI